MKTLGECKTPWCVSAHFSINAYIFIGIDNLKASENVYLKKFGAFEMPGCTVFSIGEDGRQYIDLSKDICVLLNKERNKLSVISTDLDKGIEKMYEVVKEMKTYLTKKYGAGLPQEYIDNWFEAVDKNIEACIAQAKVKNEERGNRPLEYGSITCSSGIYTWGNEYHGDGFKPDYIYKPRLGVKRLV